MKRIIPILASGLAAGLLAWQIWLWDPGSPDDAGHPVLQLASRPRGGDFRLHSAQGPLDLADLRGRVVLVYFGYTWCPDICPTNLAYIAKALDELGPTELEQVQVLFITVDPRRDTPERLTEYLGYFHSRILGLTGSEAEIAAVASRYGAAFRRHDEPGSAMGYTVDHSASSYLINPDGRLARTLDHATPSTEIAAAIRSSLPDRSSRALDSSHQKMD